MPVGKHGKKQANAKKKANRGVRTASVSDGTAANGVGAVTERTEFPTMESFRPESEENGPSTPLRSTSDSAKDSIYIRYKKSTQRLKDKLQSMVPPAIFASDSVNALMEATDYIVQHDLPVESSLLNDLKLSIRVRKRIAQDKYGGGDKGHSHFIAVLAYCFSHLLPRRLRNVASKQESFTDHSLPNRFAKLSTEDTDSETDDDDDDDQDLPQRPQPRPVETVPTRLTIQELITGTDRSNIILFLMTLGELMSFNVTHFTKLKEAAAWVQRDGLPPSILIEQMMEASVAANFAIQQVASLEQVFIHDHPHLNTVYRVFANLVLPELVQNLTRLVSKHSPRAAHFSERHAIEFLGDAMECAFRNPSDPHNQSSTLVRDFLTTWQFRESDGLTFETIHGDESIQQVFEGVQAVAKLEVAFEKERACPVLSLWSSVSNMTSHSWLRDPFIGQNRSITHTIRLVQCLSNLVKERQGRLVGQPGFFGTPWRDRRTAATKTQIDMDELLMGDILPSLINICFEGLIATNLPFENELLVGFVQIKHFVKHPEQPVTWSLAFTIHSILMSVFEVQGPHSTFLAETAQATFEKYISQLEWAKKMRLTTIERRPPIWDSNIQSLLNLRWMVHVNFPRTREQTLVSLWNPFCAGAFLSYLAYYGNLEGGTSLVDSVAQLRVTMHLFNALKQARVIRTGQIEVLDGMFEIFKDCKSIWEGPLPVKGQYRTRWWIAFGMKADRARQMGRSSLPSSNGDTTRKMTPIELEHLSKSFRRIVRRDFRGVVDKYHTKEQRKKHEPLYKHAVRVNDTLDAMEADERLLGTNWICLGYYLNQFYISLFNVWGWMPIVEQIVRETPTDVKQGRRTDFRRVGPNSFEASDENMKYQCMSHIFADRVLGALDEGDMLVATRCAEFMEVFYNKIHPEMVMWFTPTRYE